MRRSLQRITLTTLVLFVSGLSPALSAEREEQPRIKTMMSSPREFIDDLKVLIVGLAKESKQWENNVFPNIEIFLLGVDYNKPLHWDVLLNDGSQEQESGYRYQPCIPLEPGPRGLKTFRQQNLEPIGIEPKLRKRDYYRLDGTVFQGWMRIVDDTTKDYACIAAKGYEDDIPDGMTHPNQSHKALLKTGYDLGLELVNKAGQTELRKTQADHLLAYTMKEVVQKPDETQAAFNLRKLSQQQKYEQMQRIYVEAEQFHIGWTTHKSEQRGEAVFDLSALPGTDLLKYLATMGSQPSRFAAINMPDDPVLGMRINVPFDDFRRAQLNEWYPVAREAAKGSIDSSKRFSDNEKGPAKQAADLFFDMLVAGDPLGRLDMSADITRSKAGNHVFVAGVLAADGKAADEIVELLPKLKEGWTIKMGAETVGETTIHKIDASADVPKALTAFFGASALGYVATSPSMVWMALGDGSLERLKAAIAQASSADQAEDKTEQTAAEDKAGDKTEQSAAAEPESKVAKQDSEAPKNDGKAAKQAVEAPQKIVDLKLHAGPLVAFSDDLAAETGVSLMKSINIKPPGGAAGKAGEGRAGLQPIDPVEMRQVIRRSLVDIDDRVTGVIESTGDGLNGKMTFAPGILRSVGKIVAKIAEDNL